MCLAPIKTAVWQTVVSLKLRSLCSNWRRGLRVFLKNSKNARSVVSLSIFWPLLHVSPIYTSYLIDLSIQRRTYKFHLPSGALDLGVLLVVAWLCSQQHSTACRLVPLLHLDAQLLRLWSIISDNSTAYPSIYGPSSTITVGTIN